MEVPVNRINATVDLYKDRGYEVHLVGHSLGGLYVQHNYTADQIYTINSPFSRRNDVQHIKNKGDPFNILQALVSTSAFFQDIQWHNGGHSVDSEQWVSH